MPQKIRLRVTWDSGPYSIYYRAPELELSLQEVVEVPEDVYLRYEKAEDELRASQNALDEAIEAAEKCPRR